MQLKFWSRCSTKVSFAHSRFQSTKWTFVSAVKFHNLPNVLWASNLTTLNLISQLQITISTATHKLRYNFLILSIFRDDLQLPRQVSFVCDSLMINWKKMMKFHSAFCWFKCETNTKTSILKYRNSVLATWWDIKLLTRKEIKYMFESIIERLSKAVKLKTLIKGVGKHRSRFAEQASHGIGRQWEQMLGGLL